MRPLSTLLAIAALLQTNVSALQIESQIQIEEELTKDAHEMQHKDCGSVKNPKAAKFCADYNLTVDKTNAAIKHCVHSSHHDAAKKTACINQVVAERDSDLKDLEAAEGAKGKGAAPAAAGPKKEDPVKKVQEAAAAAAKAAAEKLKA